MEYRYLYLYSKHTAKAVTIFYIYIFERRLFMKPGKIQKSLSILLCLCMVLQAVTLTVFASDDCEHTFDCEYYYGVEDGHYAECDECGAYFEDTLEDHVNEDNDENCDLCDYYVGHEHTFDEEYYHGEEDGHYAQCDQCDYYLEDTFEDHVNEDNDDNCDLCDYYVGHEHTFDEEYYHGEEDGHYAQCDQCDFYLEDTLEEHINELGDHYCDVCDYCLSDDHIYSGNFYHSEKLGHYVRCDMCEEYDESSFAAHEDMDGDEYCDKCDFFVNCIFIVLAWGDIPSDLDSHLIYTGSNGSGEIAYYSMELYGTNGELISDLDTDDTDYYGPETVTVYKLNPGDSFRYYVHDYSNGGNPASGEMAKSGATVNVYRGTELIATYSMPTDIRGYIWEVFSYSDDGLTELEHDYTETRVDAAACGEYGYYEYYCENCGDSYQVYDETPAGHLDIEVRIENETEPDCENEGYYDEITYCAACNEELDRVTVTVSSLGHNYENGICTNCGATDPNPPVIIRGDVNGDGYVNAKDTNIMKRIISGALDLDEYIKVAGDINEDGTVNAFDANLVTRISAGRL